MGGSDFVETHRIEPLCFFFEKSTRKGLKVTDNAGKYPTPPIILGNGWGAIPDGVSTSQQLWCKQDVQAFYNEREEGMVSWRETMETNPRPIYLTQEEYFARESIAETKSEYVDGRIVAMAGASLDHGQIIFNLTQILGPQLKPRGYRMYTNDIMVKPSATRYYYPDVVIFTFESNGGGYSPPTTLRPCFGGIKKRRG